MDIKITDSSLRKFLDTKADAEILSQNVTLCGPTFDRIHQVKGDYIYDIEAITNRVDTACALGVARESAIILSQFNIPAKFLNDPYTEKVSLRTGKSMQFHFKIDADLVPRFTAIAIENISVRKSPKEIIDMLENCGQRPINNVVDITNELTILYGLPSHIFDLDKLAAQMLTIRKSSEGETITTLDNVQNTLKGGDIVIEDGAGRLVDLCGVMGGQIAEVDEHTKNVLLIAPVYRPKNIRQTSLYLQKRTLASQIFEKQPDPEMCLPLLSKAVQLFKERAGGHVSSDIFDFYPHPNSTKSISVDLKWLNSFVGIELDRPTVISLLSGLGFGGTIEKDTLICTVPSWRYHDINIREDMAEEIARVYGYYKLPPILPCVSQNPEPENLLLKTESKIKRHLSAAGYHETYNSSLCSLSLLEKTGLSPEEHLKLSNSLSEDYEYLRSVLTPSLLENYSHNQGKTELAFRMFEIANRYHKNSKNSLPDEISSLAILSETEYRQAKGELETLLKTLNVDNVSFQKAKTPPVFFLSESTASITAGKIILGYIGLIKPLTLHQLNLTGNPIAIEINLEKLTKKINTNLAYRPISEFPLMIESITIQSKKPLGEIMDTIKSTSKLIQSVSFVESYGDKHTFKIYFGSFERNLEQKETNSLKNIIQEKLKN